MKEVYLMLPQKEQAQILRGLATNSHIKRDPLLLEKDIWICWALDVLFSMPGGLPMAFKGGTSLSKAFHVIDRFSEDVDVTISCGAFNCGNPFEDGLSKTKIKSIGLEIRSRVTEHIKDVIIPHFQNASSHFGVNAPKMELDSDGETLHLHYPSVLEKKWLHY